MVWLKLFFLIAVVAVLFQAPLHWAIRKLVGRHAVSPEPSGPLDGMGWMCGVAGVRAKPSTLFSSGQDEDYYYGSDSSPSPTAGSSQLNVPERYSC